MINLLRIVSHVCLNGSESIRASISEITWYQNIFLPFLLTIKNPNYKTTCKNIMELSPEDIRETSDIYFVFWHLFHARKFQVWKTFKIQKWPGDTLVMRECYYILVHTVTLGQTQWRKLPVRWEIWSSHWVCRMFQIWQILGIGIWRFSSTEFNITPWRPLWFCSEIPSSNRKSGHNRRSALWRNGLLSSRRGSISSLVISNLGSNIASPFIRRKTISSSEVILAKANRVRRLQMSHISWVILYRAWAYFEREFW